jgi:hypothetical protein
LLISDCGLKREVQTVMRSPINNQKSSINNAP